MTSPLRAGLEIGYRIRPLFGIPISWLTRITEFYPPIGFRDVQVRGPYRSLGARAPLRGGRWRDARCATTWTYQVPIGIAGDALNRFVIRNEAVDLPVSVMGHPTGARRAWPGHRTDDRGCGGTGFVGGEVAAELRRRGDRVDRSLPSRGGEGGGHCRTTSRSAAPMSTLGEGLADALRGADALVIALAFRNSPMESPGLHQTFLEIDAGGDRASRPAPHVRLAWVASRTSPAQALRRTPRGHWFAAKWRAEEAVRGSGMT